MLWSADVQRVDATPIVSSGLVYALAGNGSIWAFDKETGDLRWRSQMDGWVFQISTPACSGDKIFAATDSGLLAAFDALTGQKLWEHLLTDKRFEAPLTCADGRLYLGEGSAYGSGEKRFFCFYENGTECWNIGYNQETGRFEDRGWSTPVGFCTSTPVVWNGRVYLGAGEHGHDGRLVCLNDSDGEPIWSYPVEAGVKASPAVSTARDRPRILFTTATVNGSVYCIEDQGDEARLLWKLNPPDDGYILGGVAISDGRVYFGTEGGQVHGKLYCLSDEDGWPQFHLNPRHTGSTASRAPMSNQTAWISEEIGAQPGSSVSVADGRVYVNCVDNLTCLDQHSGGILWTFPFKAAGDYAFGFSPVCDKGRVFFTSDRTYCLNASDGKELWSFCPPTGRFAVDGSPSVAEGRVVVSDWDGHHYYCLNEWTGEELWNFAVDGNAQSTPTIDQERVIFGGWEWGLGGKIYCASLKNGSEIWNLSTRNSPCGSATIHEGVVYMATYNFEGDGDLLALSLDNGSVLWKAQISPTDSTPAWADGRVYICGGCEGFSDLHTYCFD
ncbi:MAG: PQQ-binding-like beta-propeller repeat protein, partial [Methanothrix sp.]|nr:PQQ-binding-like beta-propeller repeat protein [Methanothrix sp.]